MLQSNRPYVIESLTRPESKFRDAWRGSQELEIVLGFVVLIR